MIALTFSRFSSAWRRGRLLRQRTVVDSARPHPGRRALSSVPHFSLPLWNLLPKLRFLQFPWRWLVVVEAPMGIFFAAAIWTAKRWWRVVAHRRVLLHRSFRDRLFVRCSSSIQDCDEEDSVTGMLAAYRSGQGLKAPMSTRRRARTIA